MRFDACAHSYDAHAAPQREFAACVADFIELKPAERVVEFGAGTGALTRHLCAKGAVVHATDASPTMAELGRRAVPDATWSRLDAFQDVLPTAPLQLSSGLLQWAPDPLLVLQNWRRALLPGGRMVHAFPCEPCLAEWRAIVSQNPVRWRNEAEWCAIFTTAGLLVQRQQLWIRKLVFPSTLHMLRAWHESGLTARPLLTAGQLRQAIRTYDHLHRTPGGVTATWAWLAVQAGPAGR